MPTTLPTQRGIDPAATTPMPTVDATLRLSARTLSWLARAPAGPTGGPLGVGHATKCWAGVQ